MNLNCKNCANQLRGEFCSKCGQKSKVKRINFKYLLSEIPNSILQLNRGFFFTIKELVVRPGHSIREFLLGQRVKHYKPIGFLLITTTIYVLSSFLLERNTFFYDAILGFEEGANPKKEITETPLLNWISKYQVYIPLMILPIFSLSTYIAFLKSQYNYFEHLVINFYITGQQMMIYWILGFIFFKENIFMAIPLLIGFVYNFWTFIQLFENKKLTTKIGLIFLSYIIFVIAILIMILIIAGISKMMN